VGVEREIRVPDIGDFESVEVIEVLVSRGDSVQREDSLITIESDKASMEIPSPFSGVVEKIAVAVGDRVSQDSLIAVLTTEDGDGARPQVESTPETTPAKPVDESTQQSTEAPPPAPESFESRSTPAPDDVAAPARGAHASPSVRRFARQLGADLVAIQGTGRKGRVVAEDVQNYVKRALAQSRAAGAPENVIHVEPAPAIDFAQFGEIEIEKLNNIRKIAAKALHRSWVTIPHVTQFDDADITELEAYRKGQQSESEKRGVKLTLLAFLMKAVVSNLKELPRFCASLDNTGESLILKRYYHIGVAVDTPNGLVVPVVRDVDRKGLYELASELSAISERARNRKLKTADLAGGCFSISSLGGIGGSAFTPIINPPEVAILGVSRHFLKPVYVAGELVPRLILPLSLSYDHRVIDGADAARFTTQLKAVLSDVRNLVL
jgi:pyruvate dehydrogenase E2 component (dihydrolipoamide acetyltransferase)